MPCAKLIPRKPNSLNCWTSLYWAMPTFLEFRKREHVAEIATDSSVELFADAYPIMLIIEMWIFLVLYFLVSSLLIVLSISWWRSLLDSIASSFWAEMALVSWLITELLSNATDVSATPLMHCTERSLQKNVTSVSLGFICYLVSLIDPMLTL